MGSYLMNKIGKVVGISTIVFVLIGVLCLLIGLQLNGFDFATFFTTYKKEIMFGAVAVVLFLLIAVYLIHINKNNIED